jgi:xanthine/uracil permease
MSLSWVTIRLEIMGSTVLFLVAVFAVFLNQFGRVNPLLLGVALVYALQLTALFQRCVQGRLE